MAAWTLDDMQPGILYCDARVGSGEFAAMLRKSWGIKATSDYVLPSADFAFVTAADFMGGKGPYKIGIERKALGDLVGSLLKNRLGGHQIPRLLTDYDLCWLLVEGLWRCSSEGDSIETPSRGGWSASRYSLTYTALNGWLTRYDVMGGGKIRRWRTSSPSESTAWLASLFRWCCKPWKNHQAIYVEKQAAPEKALMFRANDIQRTAASISGLGTKNAIKAGRYFASITEMVVADVEDWQAAGVDKAAINKSQVAMAKEIRPSKVKARLYREREARRLSKKRGA